MSGISNKNSNKNSNKKSNKKSKPSYKEGNYEFYIMEVINDVCNKDKYPIKQKYAEAIAKYRNEHDPTLLNLESDQREECLYEAENVRPNVSKTLDRMCNKDNPKVLCFGGKYYVPNNNKYFYEKLGEEFQRYLKDKIIVDEKQVMLISYNVCAFWAHANPSLYDEYGDTESSENKESKKIHKTVHEIIAECLGDYGFGVFGEKNFIQAMVKCTEELGVVPNENSRDFAVIRALEYAITKIYEQQHKVIKRVKKTDLKD